MEWNNIKINFDNLLGVYDKKPKLNSNYLTAQFENLKNKRLEYSTVAFRIVDIKEQGFFVRVSGLYGYISFYHMPWKYTDIESWITVYPLIKNKIFFAKIYELSRSENSISIKLNGEIPQFKRIDLKLDEKYQGVIIYKTVYGIFVDIGYGFNWASGSIVAMIHKSYFEEIAIFDELTVGQILDILYWGVNSKEELIIGTVEKMKDWITGEIEELIGDIVNVTVNIIDEGYREYIVENMYQGVLPVSRLIYVGMNGTQIKYAINNLRDQEIIKCEIIGINKKRRALKLKWISNTEIENVITRELSQSQIQKQISLFLPHQNSIENIIKDETVEKLNLLGKDVNVEVLKIDENSSNKYLVNSKYKGKLSISNANYRISVIEKKFIEQNLQDGDVINCEVLSVEKKSIRVKWNISDDELSRFINV